MNSNEKKCLSLDESEMVWREYAGIIQRLAARFKCGGREIERALRRGKLKESLDADAAAEAEHQESAPRLLQES